MVWRRAFVVWLLMAIVEIVHGALRAVWLVPVVGDWRARQIGAVVGTALLLIVAVATIRWVRARSRAELLRIGLFWVALMLSFEMGAGRALAGFSWARIWSDYDLAHGGLLGLGMLGLLLSPLVAARVRGLPVGSR